MLSAAGFDAPALVKVSTVTLGDDAGHGTPVAMRPNGSYMASAEDVNGDGRPDLVLHVDRAALIAAGALTPSSTQLVLLAELTDGRQVRGADAVRVIP